MRKTTMMRRWTTRFIIFVAGALTGAYIRSTLHLICAEWQIVDESSLMIKGSERKQTTAAAEVVPQIILHVKSEDLLLPTPVLVMGMMKAGTTSIESYFRCGFGPDFQHRVSHYDCYPRKVDLNTDHIRLACGKRMRRNVEKFKKTPFDGIDHFDVYAELDAQEKAVGMTLPQDPYLQEIHDNYPNATWILNTRDPMAWLNSVDKWRDLRQRFIDNRFQNFPKGMGTKDEEMLEFYEAQAERVRQFVRLHPSHTLVEVAIDDPQAGVVMEKTFGISRMCWRKRNVNISQT